MFKNKTFFKIILCLISFFLIFAFLASSAYKLTTIKGPSGNPIIEFNPIRTETTIFLMKVALLSALFTILLYLLCDSLCKALMSSKEKDSRPSSIYLSSFLSISAICISLTTSIFSDLQNTTSSLKTEAIQLVKPLHISVLDKTKDKEKNNYKVSIMNNTNIPGIIKEIDLVGDSDIRPIKVQVNPKVPVVLEPNSAKVCNISIKRNELAKLHVKNIDDYNGKLSWRIFYYTTHKNQEDIPEDWNQYYYESF